MTKKPQRVVVERGKGRQVILHFDRVLTRYGRVSGSRVSWPRFIVGLAPAGLTGLGLVIVSCVNRIPGVVGVWAGRYALSFTVGQAFDLGEVIDQVQLAIGRALHRPLHVEEYTP